LVGGNRGIAGILVSLPTPQDLPQKKQILDINKKGSNLKIY